MPRDDDALERRLGWILRGGVIASSALLITGLVLTLGPAVVGRGFSPAIPARVHVGQGFSLALLRAGLVVLLATPIARVAASAISYAVSKDWLFVILTSVVLLELAAAVFAAITG